MLPATYPKSSLNCLGISSTLMYMSRLLKSLNPFMVAKAIYKTTPSVQLSPISNFYQSCKILIKYRFHFTPCVCTGSIERSIFFLNISIEYNCILLNFAGYFFFLTCMLQIRFPLNFPDNFLEPTFLNDFFILLIP